MEETLIGVGLAAALWAGLMGAAWWRRRGHQQRVDATSALITAVVVAQMEKEAASPLPYDDGQRLRAMRQRFERLASRAGSAVAPDDLDARLRAAWKDRASWR